MFLSNGARTAIEKLNSCGFKAYAVGGACRDYFMNKPCSDTDVTTSALPDETEGVFSEYTVIPTGIKHGTVTVIIDGEKVEITTFRTESGYKDNRHPDGVDFVSNINEDLKRRDFTVNAIAYNENEGFIDLFGGINDIKNKIIRAVGDPEERFKEDALRILRALRFSSKLGFEIEKNTALAALKCAPLIKNVSPERVFSELTGILAGDGAENTLLKYKEIVFTIIPELKPCDGFMQKTRYHNQDVYTHIVKSVAYSDNDRMVRLALLLHDVGKPYCFSVGGDGVGHFYGHQKLSAEISEKILKRFKADNKTLNTVVKLIYYHDASLPPDKIKIKYFLKNHGFDFFKYLIKVKCGDALAHAEPYGMMRMKVAEEALICAEEIVKNGECYSLKSLAVNGNDLKSLGFTGSEIKDKLDKALNLVIEGKLDNEKESIIRCLNERFKR